jgi:hypothetical protein
MLRGGGGEETKNPAAQEMGRLRMAKLSHAQRVELGKKAYSAVPAGERKRLAKKGGKSAWAKLSKDERSAEMKRRARVRAKNSKKD